MQEFFERDDQHWLSLINLPACALVRAVAVVTIQCVLANVQHFVRNVHAPDTGGHVVYDGRHAHRCVMLRTHTC